MFEAGWAGLTGLASGWAGELDADEPRKFQGPPDRILGHPTWVGGWGGSCRQNFAWLGAGKSEDSLWRRDLSALGPFGAEANSCFFGFSGVSICAKSYFESCFLGIPMVVFLQGAGKEIEAMGVPKTHPSLCP